MTNHQDLSDIEFLELLSKCGLPPGLFSHEAHLRLAWILIKQNGLQQAEIRIQQLLKNYVAALGAPEKYNTTLTLAAMKAVHHFMKKSSSVTFNELLEEFPRLKFNFKALMATHYGFDIYTSEQAKTTYLEPDLIPFD